jgi:hypothetical protein
MSAEGVIGYVVVKLVIFLLGAGVAGLVKLFVTRCRQSGRQQLLQPRRAP